MKLVLEIWTVCLPHIAHVVLLTLVYFLVCAILGVNLFAGRFWFCDDGSVYGAADCVGVDVRVIRDARGHALATITQRSWSNPPQHFDHAGAAMLTLFEVSTLEGWITIMHHAMDARWDGWDLQPRRDGASWAALYFVVFVALGAFFIMNLLIAVYIDSFNQSRGTGLLTAKQVSWVEMKSLISSVKAQRVKFTWPHGTIRHRVHHLITAGTFQELRSCGVPAVGKEQDSQASVVAVDAHTDSLFDRMILAIILLNSGVLACTWKSQSQQWDRVLRRVDIFFVVCYSTELCLKVLAFGSRPYFRGKWNQFDCFIVIMSICDLTPLHDMVDSSIFQVFRILRMAKLVRRAQGIRALVSTLVLSAPAITNLSALLGIVFFCFAVSGVQLFGAMPRGEYLTAEANFETVSSGMFLLLRITTGENWNGIMHECGSPGHGTPMAIAVVYFVSFYLIAALAFMKLFIAIILDQFLHCFSRERNRINPQHIAHFRATWAQFDKTGKGFIPASRICAFVKQIAPPLGQIVWSRAELLRFYHHALFAESARRGHLQTDIEHDKRLLPPGAELAAAAEVAAAEAVTAKTGSGTEVRVRSNTLAALKSLLKGTPFGGRKGASKASEQTVSFTTVLQLLVLRRMGLRSLEYKERLQLHLIAHCIGPQVAAMCIGAAARGIIARRRTRIATRLRMQTLASAASTPQESAVPAHAKAEGIDSSVDKSNAEIRGDVTCLPKKASTGSSQEENHHIVETLQLDHSIGQPGHAPGHLMAENGLRKRKRRRRRTKEQRQELAWEMMRLSTTVSSLCRPHV